MMEKKISMNYTMADFFADTVAKHADKEALIFVGSGKRYTYRDMDDESNRFGHWGHAQGLAKGQTIVLAAHNCPEMVTFCLGMAKLGVCTSLLNPNISGKPLKHAISLSGASVLVGTEDTIPMLLELGKDHSIWLLASPEVQVPKGAQALLPDEYDAFPVDKALREGTQSCDALFHIFTSGTTGLPKAAKFNHVKFWGSGSAVGEFFGLKASDRIYCSLPLYHSSAMVLGVAAAWSLGAPIILRKKFSASNFWKDCVDHRATCAQYIGELLRYLLSAPASEHDRQHNVRMVYGNGLRRDVWAKFVDRFAVPHVAEFYGSTEGNATLINAQNKMGAVGFISPLVESKYPVALVRFDVSSETVVRNDEGRCITCLPGEPGELLGLIKMDDPTRRFDGYTDSKSTEKKIVRNVFEDGDAWFRTGDLLRRDAEGFMYFVDRIGDTFRWKGENVSTAEVGEAITAVSAVEEANVYGVQVGDQEGRCGMASVVPSQGFDDQTVVQEVYLATEESLPPYARPMFLRIQPQLETTVTFKQMKGELVKEGFDPSAVSDPLYYRSSRLGCFVPLTKDLYRSMQSGEERV